MPRCGLSFRFAEKGWKSHGIDSVQDYFDRQNSLGRYLTTEWLRLTLDHVDKKNKNQSKARTLPLWLEVSEKLSSRPVEFDAPLDPLPKEKADVDQLIKQMVGVGRAAARFQGKEDLTDDELLAYMVKGAKTKLRCKAVLAK